LLGGGVGKRDGTGVGADGIEVGTGVGTGLGRRVGKLEGRGEGSGEGANGSNLSLRRTCNVSGSEASAPASKPSSARARHASSS